jgi:hypothetical protein
VLAFPVAVAVADGRSGYDGIDDVRTGSVLALAVTVADIETRGARGDGETEIFGHISDWQESEPIGDPPLAGNVEFMQ